VTSLPGARVAVVAFDELGARTAYDVWRLRQRVFVVEQQCPYPDLDGRDTEPGTRHVLLSDAAGALLGCARVLDDRVLDDRVLEESAGGERVWRIGRVVLEPTARGLGLADLLMDAALAWCTSEDPARAVVLDAQTPLAAWYTTFGFTVTGPEFLDDGIPHVPMRRAGGGPQASQGPLNSRVNP
jgi:ElaA protein